MFNATVNIASGAEAGRVVPIADEPVVFGRTSASDVVIHWDKLTSSRHFQVRRDGTTLALLDLGSTNGTFVNGNSVRAIQLVDGDRIEAGQTVFEVREQRVAARERGHTAVDERAVNGRAMAEPPRQYTAAGAAPSFDPYSSNWVQVDANAGNSERVEAAIKRATSIDAFQATCASGLLRLEGKLEDAFTAVDIASRFVALGHSFWIVDFSRLGMPLPASLDVATSKLFDWLPDNAAVQTPQLLTQAEFEDWKSVLEDGWGADAIVGLHSELEKPKLLAALRELGGGSANPRMGKGMVGYCWPTILSAVLENDTDTIVAPLFGSVQIVLIESGEQGWRMLLPECERARVTPMQLSVVESPPVAEGSLSSAASED